jgi:xanthine dehydrogenase accessory factor
MGDSRDCPDIYRRAAEWIDSGRDFAAVVVVRAAGSTPQVVGARALVDSTGEILGTIGGGAVEAETQRLAVEACRADKPALLDFRLDQRADAGTGPICGGAMQILIDPTAARHRACFAAAADALKRRRRGVLLTRILRSPSDGSSSEPPTVSQLQGVSMRWLPEEKIPADTDFPGGETVARCFKHETPQMFVDDSPEHSVPAEVFVEPVLPRPHLVIAGAGHVGRALARRAVEIGFDVTVIDDRPEYTQRELFPEGVTTRCGDVPRELGRQSIADDTYIVIATREHRQDAAALRACVGAPAVYIGMIGSRRKVRLIRDALVRSGEVSAEVFDRVFAPIGLDIGAVTVPEIATSIAAELIAVRRRVESCSLRGVRESR